MTQWTQRLPGGSSTIMCRCFTNHLHIILELPSSKKGNVTPTDDIEAVDEKTNKELDLLRGMVETFLKNPEPRTWIPPDSATLNKWEFLTKLRIPSYGNGNPSLLFHNLDVCDEKEIKIIFGPGAHKYVVINYALNTSQHVQAGAFVTPIYGPVTEQLVEYGIARLGERDKGQIVEPLAFLSLMKWLERTDHLNPEANLRLQLGDQAARGSAFEEVGIFYLLRALSYPVPFTTGFDLRSTPSWANEKYQIVARLDKVDVPVDVLGTYPQNPGLSVVDYASCIEDIIHWI
jgi:hypothetical protein